MNDKALDELQTLSVAKLEEVKILLHEINTINKTSLLANRKELSLLVEFIPFVIQKLKDKTLVPDDFREHMTKKMGLAEMELDYGCPLERAQKEIEAHDLLCAIGATLRTEASDFFNEHLPKEGEQGD